MHHPGPPRFVSPGDSVDLAPRDPDPGATYRWSVERAPPGSTVDLTDAPVQSFAPDAAGRYVLALSAPDGVHRLTVRCLPGAPASEPRTAPGSGPEGGLGRAPGGEEGGRSAYRETAPVEEGGNGDAGRPRIRLDGHRAEDAVVVTADPRPHPDAGERASDLDVEFVVDDRDALGADAATIEGRSFRIPVDRLPGRARVHAVAVGEAGHSVPDAVDVRREGDEIRVDRPHDPPGWALDAAYYEVYVRTFAPGAGDGERLAAVADRLDHLADLGVDALWLTPVLGHDGAPHGYNVTDFFSVAADLGDREDLRHLVDRAHERGIRVLFDLVLNHSARDHPRFREAYGNPDSEYRDWYEWQDTGEPGTYFGWEHIANFDFTSLAVRRHLLDVVDAWAPLVDGFRCDMAWAVPGSFWREVRDRVTARDPEFLLLDETIPYVPDFHGLFDVHFDSTTYATARSVGTGRAPATALLDAIEERRRVGFPDHAGFLLYAENHDETRYLAECGRPAAFAVAGALCTLPGAPLVYAGQELGQLGQRDDIVWDAADGELLAHYRRLLGLRRSMPALAAAADLRRIGYAVPEGDPERVVAYGRVRDDGVSGAAGRDTGEGAGTATDGGPADAAAAVVLCNFGEGTATVSPDPEVEPVDAVTGERVAPSGEVAVEDVVVLPTTPSELSD